MSEKGKESENKKCKVTSLLCKWQHHLYIQVLHTACDNTVGCKEKLKYEYLQ